MADRRARVLDVGNCDPDHGMIRRMLEQNFDVEIDRVMFVDEAEAALRSHRYALVLVNRLIFADGSEGMELHRRLQANASLPRVPIMLISNFPEAQKASVAAGGVEGFGKADVNSKATAKRLAAHLPLRNATVPHESTAPE